ncbi:MAG: sulfite exporter TauE/SafE family protein [Proteobacteria bacterium]|nr:sulfite exporter TauE/SafE family protein [Pseudomonadota bacterium]
MPTETTVKPAKNQTPSSFSSRSRLVARRLLAFLFGIAGIALIVYLDARLRSNTSLPELSLDMSSGLLFVVGFLTGFHCVGMCGALVLGYATKSASTGKLRYSGHLLYGLGKTISYTAIGAGFGLMGSIIAFTPQVRGIVGMVAGVFLLLFGLSLLNVWPSLRNFRIKTPPALLRFIGAQSRKYGHPFVIGLLNGLMVICGPLQAMYVMAAGTGSALEGGKLMLVFGLGTLPVMLGFGMLTSMASASLAPKIIRFSGAIVVILGAIMLNRGLVLSGAKYDLTTGLAWVSMQLRDQTGIDMSIPGLGYQSIEMTFNGEGATQKQIVLQKGVPVKWKIHNDEGQSCVTGVVAPKLGLDIPLKKGEQIIEFTPQQEGIIPWACNMGMTTGTFLVVDPNGKKDEKQEKDGEAKE